MSIAHTQLPTAKCRNLSRIPENQADDFPSVSVVIPVYNSQGTLSDLIARIEAVLGECTSDFEILLVNDCSRDNSWQVIQDLTSRHPSIRGFDLMRNFGQHNALLCGLRAARHEVIVTLDDDLQHPPEEIPLLLQRLAAGYDVVYGTPVRQQHGLWRDLASYGTKLALTSTMGAETARNVSAFRAFRTQLRDACADFHGAFVSLDVLLTWGTSRFSAVAVRHEPRRVGASNYTLRKLLQHAVNMITGFTTMPLRLASFVGFAFTALGFLLLCQVLIRYALVGTSVPGFPFLASIVAIFSGTQLFALGIIGEYLARMYTRTMARPTYVVRSQAASAMDEASCSIVNHASGR